MLTVYGYKCGLLTIESRPIRNVGNLFSVSFSPLLIRIRLLHLFLILTITLIVLLTVVEVIDLTVVEVIDLQE